MVRRPLQGRRRRQQTRRRITISAAVASMLVIAIPILEEGIRNVKDDIHTTRRSSSDRCER
jgi:hypothetical protein